MNKQVKVVEDILFDEHLTGKVDLHNMAVRIVSALFIEPIEKTNDEKIDLSNLRKRNPRHVERVPERRTY